jgi:hypothetical protein
MSEEGSEWIQRLPQLGGLFVDHGKLSLDEIPTKWLMTQ